MDRGTDNSLSDPVDRQASLILGGQDLHSLTETVSRRVEDRAPFGWWVAFGISVALLAVFVFSTGWLFWDGVGVWGLNHPVSWGWAIVNFVFWVGIGHAGTLISAILFLLRQSWRTSINRSAEAMTIFAVVCALIFPVLHLGRPWFSYWMFPIPNQMGMWPNYRSPLLWDVFAICIYGTVSFLFWYVGMVPDLAMIRDRAKTRGRRVVYGALALGWRFSARHWNHYERTYLLLAALATPLVLSVHSIVSMDFAVSQLPGWHSTIFPPYFVAGAIFSGFAMVTTLMVLCRSAFKMKQIITVTHLENIAKIMLLTGSMVAYSYVMELFIAWYSGREYEYLVFVNRALGDYAWAYWIMIGCNVGAAQLLWFKRLRRSAAALFVLSIAVNVGMWFERFVIVVSSLHHDFLPATWTYYAPTFWDVAALAGSFGLFLTLFCLFVRWLPMVAAAEVKAVLPGADPHYRDDPDSAKHSGEPIEGSVV